MSQLPLPGLTPDDPENLLSPEARQRILAALIDAERIRTQALSTVETHYRAEPRGDVGLMEYMSSGSAYVDLTESRMQAARTVLRVEEEEYRKLGLLNRRFREIMEEKIEGAVYSLELSTLQKRTLELEFVWTTPQQTEDEPGPVERNEETAPAMLRVKAFMEQKALDIRAFAKRIGRSKRTVQSVLAGDYVGKETRRAVAEALGTTPEELFRK
jgi:lambda repressor-like predicted transcriptional regulator